MFSRVFMFHKDKHKGTTKESKMYIDIDKAKSTNLTWAKSL